MNCVICKNGTTAPGHVTVTLDRNGSLVIVKNVPAEVCSNCGEYYLDEATSTDLYRRAEFAIANGSELEIVQLKAA